MHNIKTDFGKFYRICKEFFDDETDERGNFQFYPKVPAMADLEVISLACVMEALGIDSENLLWSKIKKDYPRLFPHLICRTRLIEDEEGFSPIL